MPPRNCALHLAGAIKRSKIGASPFSYLSIRNLRPNTRVFRISHSTIAMVVQTTSAAIMTAQGLWVGRTCQRTMANPASPTQPSDAPAASMLAAMRPRFVPSCQRLAMRSFSCASMSVAVAGRIAGNAKKKPPAYDPNRFHHFSLP